MKKTILLMTLCASSLALAQQEPRIPQDLILPGWDIVDKATGDLNKDNLNDWVIVYKKNDPKNIVKNNPDSLGPESFDTNPRKIIIYLNQNNQFKFFEKNTIMIPVEGSPDSPCLLDPMAEGELVIKKNLLNITLSHFTSCGGWGMGNTTYSFKLDEEKKSFRLIGEEYFSIMRNTGEITKISTNYLTGKIKTTKGGNEFDEKENHPKDKWEKMKNNSPIYFPNVTSDYSTK